MSSRVIRIGNYRLGQTIGEGSFGKVKIAEHEATGHKVAVKILNRQKIKNSKMDQKIKREIKILKLFRHPHIIRLYEVIETPQEIFLIMEWVSGGELFDYIVKHGRLSESEARRFFQQIISGVDYCHRHRVTHRDLKPENLLLDSDNNVKIADFGLSNIMHDGSFLKTSCGSPNYAAPEVITGKLYAGPEVDVWSCGVILYALLCGRLPFDEDTIPSLFKKIREGQYSFPSHVSPLARDLISKILVVDPLERMTIDQIKVHPWFVKDLPQYLQDDFAAHFFIHHSAQENKDEQAMHVVIDERVLREALERMDIFVDRMSPERAQETLQQAINDIKCGQMNDVTVAYSLIMDHRMKSIMREQYEKQTRGNGPLQQLHNWPKFSSSPPVSQFTLEVVMNQKGHSDSAMHISSSPAVSSGSYGTPSSSAGNRWIDGAFSPPLSSEFIPERSPNMMDDLVQIDTSDEVNKSENKWHLGIRKSQSTGVVTKKNATEIMSEVYRVLKLMGYKWKILGPFNIKAKPIDTNLPYVGLGMQVFKTHADSTLPRPPNAPPLPAPGTAAADSESYYMLDIVFMGGNVLNFLDATCQFKALLQL